MNRSTTDWSTLPDHILALISKGLDSLGDTMRFRAVCRSFRSSSPLPEPISPCSELKIPFPSDLHINSDEHFVLTQSTIYAIQPLGKISLAHETTKTWIVKVQQLNTGKVRLHDPLFRRYFKNLSEKLPPSLNLMDYQVKEIAKAYQLVISSNDNMNMFFRKVVVSRCHHDTDNQFVVMALYDSGNLLVWRNGDQKWTHINIPHKSIADIIYHNKKFYVLVPTGLTLAVDYKTLTITEVATPLQSMNFSHAYLIKLLKDLYMIVDNLEYGTYNGAEVEWIEFIAYKLDEKKCEWVCGKEGLENRMLFVDEDCSFYVSIEEFFGCEGNPVYFVDGGFSYLLDHHLGMGTRICNFINQGFPFPNLFKIFWPPPMWLKKNPNLAHQL